MNFMNGILPLKIISIRPNPAQEEIEVVASTFSRSGTTESRPVHPHKITLTIVFGMWIAPTRLGGYPIRFKSTNP